MKKAELFLSTLSLRRATFDKFKKSKTEKHFYPRSPCGERLQTSKLCNLLINISIHALLAESDSHEYAKKCRPSISIHALLAESDNQNIKNALARL